MRRLLYAAALAALAAGAAQASPQNGTVPAPKEGQVCLDTTRIMNTTVPDNRTILFHMQGGKIWKNTLLHPCHTLRNRGFIYEPTPPNRICGNMQTIRVTETGEVCLLGAFTPYTPPAKKEGTEP